MTTLKQNGKRLRLLVTIASYGEKNIEFLKRIIATYQSLDMEVTIFVLTEAAKNLGPGVQVLVGLPSKNPWSLPFGHKKIFADNLNRYDLFAYSEDDMEVTAENISAFLRVTPELAADEIAGFLRYEVDPSGALSFPEAHGAYHWKAATVKQRGPYTVAEFSNEHAAFYLLTQSQLQRSIASGGFLRVPYESNYDMACTASTDPYTSCGFRKVISISSLKDFLIHHMSNRYAGQIGLSLSAVEDQVQTLINIRDGLHPASVLGRFESKILHGRWSKSYSESVCQELLTLMPVETKSVLSVGCGFGDMEAVLQDRGAHVTALPLDSVVGAAASRLGIEVIYGDHEECFENLGGRKFQLVLITNLLHLLPNPFRALGDWAGLVADGGDLLISGVNFDYFPVLLKRTLGVGDYGKLGSFPESGINAYGIGAVKKHIKRAGLRIVRLQWFDQARARRIRNLPRWPERIIKGNWIIQARKAG